MRKKNILKISVIMPFYNCKDFLDDSIQSILNQTFSDFEFIIINDASTDNSDKIVKKYLDDERIIYIKNRKNEGIVYNLNHGLDIAKADIIARMDGDDISDITRFKKQYEFLKNNLSIDVVGSFIKIIDEKNNKIGERKKMTDPKKIKKDFLIHSSLVHPTTMYRKKPVLDIGKYRKKYLHTEDLDLWYRLVYSGCNVSNIPEFLLKYRIHSNSCTKYGRKKVFKQMQSRIYAIKKYKIKLRFKDYYFILIHFITGLILSGKMKQRLEGFYKKYF